MTYVVFDTENHEAEKLWDMDPDEYFRIGGFSFGKSDKVYITKKRDVLRDVLLNADFIIGSNIQAYDLQFLLTAEEHIRMADEGRICDMWTLSALFNQPSFRYVNRKGNLVYARKPGEIMKWQGLDEQAFQLGVSGKTHDLSKMAKYWGGFGKIPQNDPDYQDYLRGDVRATHRATMKLLEMVQTESDEAYWNREERIAASAALIARTGWRVDESAARERASAMEVQKNHYLEMLNRKYGLPLERANGVEYKSPHASKIGKDAIINAFSDLGVEPEELPWTEPSKTHPRGQVSFKAELLIEAVANKSEEAQNLANAVALIGGMRPLAQQLLDCMHTDGKVHPSITMLQRSGRWSTTRPGLTTFGERNEKSKLDKKLLMRNEPDHVVFEVDYSQCDARVVAAASCDERYAARFEMDDAHTFTAEMIWGHDDDKALARIHRQLAKNWTHGWGYGAGGKKLIVMHNDGSTTLATANKFKATMDRTYVKVTRWRKAMARVAERGEVVNDWGRRMKVTGGSEYTQGPALYGQSSTRELVCDSVLDFPFELKRGVVAQVHDALAFSVPKKHSERLRDLAVKIMHKRWKPKNGMEMEFPVKAGPFGANWFEASHLD